MLSKFDIQCYTPHTILSQALADLIAQFPSGNFELVQDDLPHEKPDSTYYADENVVWTLSFDGSSTSKGGGVGVVLTSGEGKAQKFSYKLTFACSNNMAEYEALVLGLLAAREEKFKCLHIQEDSNLVVKQLDWTYAIKEPTLAIYRTATQKLSGHFNELRITHVPRATNRYPDALATLASKVEITGELVDI
ncbi:uncharacterized protein LOC132314056 [Cornus florida]|uniref:uncharacterized protein LOC132314056 n=1 Tax=Cornus florida TaxID=4283 RepID=UPI00289EDD22|nr:uncharacterized protein LOC132314056 [Cornus florida]